MPPPQPKIHVKLISIGIYVLGSILDIVDQNISITVLDRKQARIQDFFQGGEQLEGLVSSPQGRGRRQ